MRFGLVADGNWFGFDKLGAAVDCVAVLLKLRRAILSSLVVVSDLLKPRLKFPIRIFSEGRLVFWTAL